MIDDFFKGLLGIVEFDDIIFVVNSDSESSVFDRLENDFNAFIEI